MIADCNPKKKCGGLSCSGGFGAFGAQKPGFGAPAGGGAFGAPGGAFGAPAATAAGGAFGAKPGGFGTPAGGSAFGAPSAFGTPGASTAGSAFGANPGAFGTSAASGSAFGAKPGGFGTPGTTAGSAFGAKPGGFGTPGAFGAPSAFGTPGASTAGSAFGAKPGGFGTPGAFGTSPTGSAFGAKPGFGSPGAFGSGIGGVSLQQQQQEQQAAMLATGIPQYQVQKWGDERDRLVEAFNHMQACWGTGQFFLSMPQSPQWNNVAPITERDPEHCFKEIAYNLLPTNDDAEGRIGLKLQMPIEKVVENEKAIAHLLQTTAFAQWQEHTVKISTISILQDGSTELIFELIDNRTKKPESATTVTDYIKAAYLVPSSANANAVKTALQQLQCISEVDPARHILFKQGFYPIVALSKEKISEYLKSPPEGVDSTLWEQGKQANRDPTKFFPTVLFGFNGLKQRVDIQEAERKKQELRLQGSGEKSIAQQIVMREEKQVEMRQRIDNLTREHTQLAARVLKIMHAHGMREQLSAQELQELRSKLESLKRSLNDPSQYRGKLNDLRARVAMQDSADEQRTARSLNVVKPSEATLQQLMQHLDSQQKGISHLLEVLQADAQRLEIIEQGYRRYIQWS
eukprot:m.128851 g.128851  ORF g.128851 m.128851 type:complete len:629 (+) comp9760_c0_seq6:346-2232(+)